MAEQRHIDTDAISESYRTLSINLESRRLLISNLRGSAEERDLAVPPNCQGFGRLHHFCRETSGGWPQNPLPIDPACRALRKAPVDTLRVQAFQNAACNWRCWYCYVPFNLLAASRRHSGWLTPTQLIDLYLDEHEPPQVIDLTGGQPDLIPEWIPWMMEELCERRLDRDTYLWSDDNLSTDYLWRYLSPADLDMLIGYANYGRVGCFKGFDDLSFSFNTRADPTLFSRQFELMGRLMDLGIDVYAYATFTTPVRIGAEVRTAMARFVDRLQCLDENLPLRTVPLEIKSYTPVERRLHGQQAEALNSQTPAIIAWQEELERRFTDVERATNIVDVPLRGRHCPS